MPRYLLSFYKAKTRLRIDWPFAEYGHMVQETPCYDAEGQEKQRDYIIQKANISNCIVSLPSNNCLVPRRLLSWWKCARKGRREGDNGRDALRLPSIPFPWSLAVHHQSLVSRSPLPCEKRSAWGGGWSNKVFFVPCDHIFQRACWIPQKSGSVLLFQVIF